MNINENLKEAFSIKPYTDKEKLKIEINKWSNSIQNSPIKNLGDLIEITEANVKEFYGLKFDSFIEKRKIESLTRPFFGIQPEKRTIFKKSDFDIWSKSVPLPQFYLNKDRNYEVEGSEFLYDCNICNAKGEITCSSCSGQGKQKCSNCSGKGQTMCNNCRGRGEVECTKCDRNGNAITYGGKCRNCGGRRHIPCNNCVQGYQNCSSCASSGQQICKTCNGNCKVTCSKCGGNKQLVDYLNLNIQFINLPGFITLNENKLNETFITEFEVDDDFLNKPFYKKEEGEFSISSANVFENLIFKNSFIKLIEQSKENKNQFFKVDSSLDTNAIKTLTERFCLYKNENIIEIFYTYKNKKYLIYFYNDFKNVYSVNSPIQEITDSFIDTAKTLFNSGKYSDAYDETIKALNIFPTNNDCLELKKNIAEKANSQYKTAFILSFFQLDRFYTGRPLLGILKLFTFGGFMIWYILDIVFLLNGTYKDSNGNIVKKIN